jgi:hypothetical protein
MFFFNKSFFYVSDYLLSSKFNFFFLYLIMPDYMNSIFNRKVPVFQLLQSFQFPNENDMDIVGFHEPVFILPGCSFLEKRSVYLNFDLRFQFSNIVYKPLSMSKIDWKVAKVLHGCFINSYDIFYTCFREKINSFYIYNNGDKDFTDNVFFKLNDYHFMDTQSQKFFFSKKQKFFFNFNVAISNFYKTPINFWLSDFFLTDSITRSSRILSICSKFFKRNI